MCAEALYSPSLAGADRIEDPLLQDLHSYWSGLRQDGSIPRRSDFDPLDVPHLLPYIILAECSDAGQKIKFRLTGSDIAFAPGSDLTGRYLHERGPRTAYLTHLCELYRLGATSAEGFYSAFAYGYSGETGPKKVARLFLPLNDCGNGPSMLLVGQVRDKSTVAAKPIWLTEPEVIRPLDLFAIESAVPGKESAVAV